MKKVVTFGEVMLRLSPPGFARLVQTTTLNVNFGGGEANVAAGLAYLGVPAQHVTRFPENDWGYAAAAAYRRYGVDTSRIVYGGERIGTYYIEQGSMMRPSKVLYDRFDSAFAHLIPAEFDWDEILKDAGWFHWTGITPAISEPAAEACLKAIQTANRLGVTVSADVNYRKNLWRWGKSVQEIMPELVAGCDVIVCGKGDAEDIFGIKTDKSLVKSSFVSAAQQVMERFPRVQKVLNTKRTSVSASHNTLSAMLYDGTQHLKTMTHEMVPMVDRIGGGDAFMAGYIYGTYAYGDDQQALDFAVAASALKHSIEGDFNLVSAAEIETVMKGDVSGKLSR